MKSIQYNKKRIASVNKQIGMKVRAIRENRGILQCELAQQVGVLGPQIHKYETGAQRISSGMLYAIGQAMNVETSAFMPTANAE